MSKTEKGTIKKAKFITTKDKLTGNVDKVIAPNGFQVGLKSKEGTSSDLLVTGATTLNDLSVTGTFIIDELDIVSDNVTTDVVNITADSLTTANVITTSADALTTGGIMNLVSDSSSTSTRSLVTIKNDNTAATGTILLHLINDSTSASADMIIESTDAGAAAAPKLRFARNSASPAIDDVLGKLLFSGKDDAGNTTLYASIRAEINDETDSGGQEDGVIVFDIIKNSSQKSVLELKNNEAVFNNAGADIDFRIESDDETHMFFIDGNENRVSIGDSTDTPAATLEVTNHATAGAYNVPLVQLNSNDTDQIAVDINAANIDADVIDITADAVTTAFVMDVTADALTTGGILNLVSDSSDANVRSLVKIKNDNTSAVRVSLLELVNDAATSAASSGEVVITTGATAGTVMNITADSLGTGTVMDVTADGLTTGGILNLVSDSSDTSARTLVTVKNDNTAAVGTVVMHLVNDAIGGFDDPILLIESTANETHPVLELKNSNASTDAEPILMFTRSDTSAEADDMTVGQIQFRGVDSGNNNEYYCQIKAFATDVTAGDEGGKMNFVVKAGGTAGTAANSVLLSIGGEDVANGTNCAVIVNEGGINCDFRVESDGEDEAIFLDASAEELHINKGESAFTTHIYNTNDIAMSVTADGVIFNEDGHGTNDFRVETTDNNTMFFVGATNNTVSVGGKSSHHDADFAVFNDYHTTAFESKITSGDYGSAEIIKISSADTSLDAGQIFYLRSAGNWVAADADATSAEAQKNLLGVGLGGNAQGVGVLLKGFIRVPSTEILNTPTNVGGLPLFLSTTAGHFDFTAPSSSGDFVRIVGYAIDESSGDVLVYFNPDSTFVEIA